MKPRHAATLAPGKCERFGEPRQASLDRRSSQISDVQDGVFLCDKCYKALKQADGPAWTWFREYRDRLISSQEK
jgi:hypothetical protein